MHRVSRYLLLFCALLSAASSLAAEIQTETQETCVGPPDLVSTRKTLEGYNIVASVASEGSVWITGIARPNANASIDGENTDAFFARVDTNGNVLFLKRFGGQGDESARGIAVSENAVWIVGATTSNDFPLMNPIQTELFGLRAAFVSKFDKSTGQLVFSTFIGGSGDDRATAVALVPSDLSVVIVGHTTSVDFPTTASGPQLRQAGRYDGFIVHMSADGAPLLGTYLGGERDDFLDAVAITNNNVVWAGGLTSSFYIPVTDNAVRNIKSDGDDTVSDGYIFAFSLATAEMIYGSYFGGKFRDAVTSVTIDTGAIGGSGTIYVGGTSESSRLPMVAEADVVLPDEVVQDARGFIAGFTPQGDLIMSQFVPGSSSINAMDVSPLDGALWVTGDRQMQADDSPGVANPLISPWGTQQDITIGWLGGNGELHMTECVRDTLESAHALTVVSNFERTAATVLVSGEEVGSASVADVGSLHYVGFIYSHSVVQN
eukprot:jgi/Mesvir1/15585/Mv03202-RA.3